MQRLASPWQQGPKTRIGLRWGALALWRRSRSIARRQGFPLRIDRGLKAREHLLGGSPPSLASPLKAQSSVAELLFKGHHAWVRRRREQHEQVLRPAERSKRSDEGVQVAPTVGLEAFVGSQRNASALSEVSLRLPSS